MLFTANTGNYYFTLTESSSSKNRHWATRVNNEGSPKVPQARVDTGSQRFEKLELGTGFNCKGVRKRSTLHLLQPPTLPSHVTLTAHRDTA
eukprot:267883-Prorocentrum_minimum.AAC.1